MPVNKLSDSKVLSSFGIADYDKIRGVSSGRSNLFKLTLQSLL